MSRGTQIQSAHVEEANPREGPSQDMLNILKDKGSHLASFSGDEEHEFEQNTLMGQAIVLKKFKNVSLGELKMRVL